MHHAQPVSTLICFIWREHDLTYDIIKLLHIAFASFWLASTIKELFEPLDLYGTYEERKHLLVKREKAAGMLGATSGMGTILSGLVLLWLIGFAGNPWALNAGIVTAIIMGLIGTFGIGGSYAKAVKAFDHGLKDAELKSGLVGVRNWNKVLLALWVLTFFLMGLRNLI